MMNLPRYLNTIGGKGAEAADGATLESYDPYTGQPWERIPRCSAVDVDTAVGAARHGREAIDDYLQTKTVWIDTSGQVSSPFVIR
jgi:acyl-CoA reductase-like NAD-dependent aldehyde dehydrogenase